MSLPDIVYQDDDLLIANKPAGVATYPISPPLDACPEQGRGTRGGRGVLVTLTEILSARFPEILPLPDQGACHRLDTDTSGLLIIARNHKSWETLREAFGRNRVMKGYTALVWGEVCKKGRIDAPIGSDPKSSKRVKVYRNRAEGRRNKAQEAVTWYEPVQNGGAVTLLRLRIKTGRRHQIRAHLAAMGHPIVGDKIYCRSPQNSLPLLNRHLLHASSLQFSHPRSGKKVIGQAVLPAIFKEIWQKIRLPLPSK